MSEPRSLTTLLKRAVDLHGYRGMNALTVLASQHDPYRQSTPSRLAAGEWFAEQARPIVDRDESLHLRGFHYALIGVTKPDGTAYANTDEDWEWLQSDAADGARWNGLLPFSAIVDQRNAAPEVVLDELARPRPIVEHGEVVVDVIGELEPRARLAVHDVAGSRSRFVGERFARQRHKLVIVGEKSSLGPVVRPLATRFHADLYLPNGEASDTMIYGLARRGAEDGRPMVVLYLSDCDPGGWGMPISVARKLQALRDLEFPELEFEVHRVALTPSQVRELELPSDPMKSTEKRAGLWVERMGLAQTEIDALATLRPAILRSLVEDALGAFYDETLDARVEDAVRGWRTGAQETLEDALGRDDVERLREEASGRLEELRDGAADLNEMLDVDTSGIELPPFEPPEPRTVNGLPSTPVIDSGWGFAEASERLKALKAYRIEE